VVLVFELCGVGEELPKEWEEELEQQDEAENKPFGCLGEAGFMLWVLREWTGSCGRHKSMCVLGNLLVQHTLRYSGNKIESLRWCECARKASKE
jgi:hypothetical protein